MKFDYMVKHDGVYYAPGEDVPMEAEPSVSTDINEEPKEVETPAEAPRRGRRKRG